MGLSCKAGELYSAQKTYTECTQTIELLSHSEPGEGELGRGKGRWEGAGEEGGKEDIRAEERNMWRRYLPDAVRPRADGRLISKRCVAASLLRQTYSTRCFLFV